MEYISLFESCESCDRNTENNKKLWLVSFGLQNIHCLPHGPLQSLLSFWCNYLVLWPAGINANLGCTLSICYLDPGRHVELIHFGSRFLRYVVSCNHLMSLLRMQQGDPRHSPSHDFVLITAPILTVQGMWWINGGELTGSLLSSPWHPWLSGQPCSPLGNGRMLLSIHYIIFAKFSIV